jgi:hypothetical protein
MMRRKIMCFFMLNGIVRFNDVLGLLGDLVMYPAIWLYALRPGE